MGYPRFRRARAHKTVRKATANHTITSTTWVAVDTTLDMTLEAQIGDMLEYTVSGLWNNTAQLGFLDVATMNGSTPVTSWATAGAVSQTSNGITGWYGSASAEVPISGATFYTVAAGDIFSGLVTLRLYARIATAGSRILYGDANVPLVLGVKNLGPVDPN